MKRPLVKSRARTCRSGRSLVGPGGDAVSCPFFAVATGAEELGVKRGPPLAERAVFLRGRRHGDRTGGPLLAETHGERLELIHERPALLLAQRLPGEHRRAMDAPGQGDEQIAVGRNRAGRRGAQLVDAEGEVRRSNGKARGVGTEAVSLLAVAARAALFEQRAAERPQLRRLGRRRLRLRGRRPDHPAQIPVVAAARMARRPGRRPRGAGKVPRTTVFMAARLCKRQATASEGWRSGCNDPG